MPPGTSIGPWWLRGSPSLADAAGAELWAYLVALRQAIGVPKVVTDCRGILDGLQKSKCELLRPQAALARTWRMVLVAIDDDLAGAAGAMRWVPSHISASRMQSAPPLDSRGEPISWEMWRANRLADALAKAAANQQRLPAAALGQLKAASDLHRHVAAVLGMVTYAANHFHAEDGEVRRDSAGQRPCKPRTWRRKAPNQEVQLLPPPPCASTSCAASGSARRAFAHEEPRSKHRRITLERQQ